MAQVPSDLIPVRITQLLDSPSASADVLLVGVYQGKTYKFRAGDLLQVAGVPTTRRVLAGTALVGGGQLSEDITLSVAPQGIGTAQLALSGVTPGVYGDALSVPQITVDATGRVMAATAVPFSAAGYVPDTREVLAGPGLLGGGSLASNVTLAVDLSGADPLTGTGTGAAGVAEQTSRADHRHPAVDLGDHDQVDGILPVDQGGTGRSLVMNPGSVIWSGADGLYVSPSGSAGQVLLSGGAAAPYWGSVLVVAPVAEGLFFGGPVSGPDADPTFRALALTDLPGDGAFTLNGVSVSLGGSGTVMAVNPHALTFGAGLSAGSYDGSAAVTLSNTGVLSFSGGTTGLTPATGTTGAITLGGTLAVSNGGTGASTAAGARSNLEAAASGANSDITSLAGLTGGVATPDYVAFDTGVTPVVGVGKLQWDPTYGTLQFGLGGGNVNLQVGQETVQYCMNNTASVIPDFSAVYITGASGNRPTVALALADSDATSAVIIGVTAEALGVNQRGYVTTEGMIHNVDTSALTEGAAVWLSSTVPGGLTSTKPVAPAHLVLIGYCVRQHATVGQLYVKVQNGYELDELHDVLITSRAAYNLLQVDPTNTYWRNVAGPASAIVGISDAQTLTNKTISGANNTLSDIGNASLSNSTVTINGGTVSLGGGIVVPAYTPNTLTFNSGGAGAASGTSFNGDTPTTVSYNTIGASPLVGSTSLTTLGTVVTGTWNASTLVPGYGGTGLTTYAAGDILYASGSAALARLALGAAGTVLQSNGTGPTWAGISGGTF